MLASELWRNEFEMLRNEFRKKKDAGTMDMGKVRLEGSRAGGTHGIHTYERMHACTSARMLCTRVRTSTLALARLHPETCKRTMDNNSDLYI